MRANTGMVLMFLFGAACQSAREPFRLPAPLAEGVAVHREFTSPIRHLWTVPEKGTTEVVLRVAYRSVPGHEATASAEIASNWAAATVRVRTILERADLRSDRGLRVCEQELLRELDPLLFPVEDGVRDAWVEHIVWERKLFF